MCGISRCWLDSMIIAQVCLRLATIKGHSKMCSFTVLGGPKTSQYLVWPPFASRSATHLLRIELIRFVDCDLWNVGPLLFNGSAKLLGIKSNHFYCHITTAHVPWWVKFLRACSRNNLHIDSTYLQTYTDDNVQNTHTYTHYTQCTIRHTYSSQNTLYIVCAHSTLCTHIYTQLRTAGVNHVMHK